MRLAEPFESLTISFTLFLAINIDTMDMECLVVVGASATVCLTTGSGAIFDTGTILVGYVVKLLTRDLVDVSSPTKYECIRACSAVIRSAALYDIDRLNKSM
jgi:hypothetical protein